MLVDAPLDYLMALPRFAGTQDEAYRPGLERIGALLEAMGEPQRAYPSVHVGGTNGKGTTASLIAAIATAASRRTGLHTSPHLFHVGERMRVDGAPAPEAWLEEAAKAHRTLFERVRPSFFEATLALSLLYFAEQEVDLAVVEVGLGGRLDATNILHPEAAIVTHIALEHTDILGDTLGAIAREKAGIFKKGVPALTGVREAEALRVLEEEARRRGAPLECIWDTTKASEVRLEGGAMLLELESPVRAYPALQAGVAGRHHLGNIGLAVRTAERVLEAPEAAIREGLREVKTLAGLRGRFEVLAERPTVVADVAHNPDALAPVLAQAADEAHRSGGRLLVVLGVLHDKDVRVIAQLLNRHAALAFAANLPTERALSADALARVLGEVGVPVFGRGTVEEGVAAARRRAGGDGIVLVTGSHWTVAELGAHPELHM